MKPENVGYVKKTIVGLTSLTVLAFALMAGKLWETNEPGHFQIKQAWPSGEMSVRNEPGMYGQWLGTIKEYSIPGEYYFSSDTNDGEQSDKNVPVEVTFNGNSLGKISGFLKYRLPAQPSLQLKLNADFGSDHAIREQIIRQQVKQVLQQTAPLMTAEEAYASKRGYFKEVAEQQLTHGLFQKRSKNVQVGDISDPSGKKTITQTTVEVVTDENGTPIVTNTSILSQYGIEVVDFTITDINVDDTTKELLTKKKEVEMMKVVAEAQAKTAQQDAITTEMKGRTRVAEAEANALVEKKTAVIAAEKEKEVAVQNKLRDKEFSEARLIKQRAEAESNRLLVSAGLTPLERAEFDMKTKIGVAEKLAGIQFPGLMVIGSGSGGSGHINPFDAVGLESFINLQEKLANKGK